MFIEHDVNMIQHMFVHVFMRCRRSCGRRHTSCVYAVSRRYHVFLANTWQYHVTGLWKPRVGQDVNPRPPLLKTKFVGYLLADRGPSISHFQVYSRGQIRGRFAGGNFCAKKIRARRWGQGTMVASRGEGSAKARGGRCRRRRGRSRVVAAGRACLDGSSRPHVGLLCGEGGAKGSRPHVGILCGVADHMLAYNREFVSHFFSNIDPAPSWRWTKVPRLRTGQRLGVDHMFILPKEPIRNRLSLKNVRPRLPLRSSILCTTNRTGASSSLYSC